MKQLQTRLAMTAAIRHSARIDVEEVTREQFDKFERQEHQIRMEERQERLEQNPTDLNREGFPSRANSDSHCVLGKEASTHGQAFIGRFADSGCPGG
jgi:hypothetical protein